MKILQKEETLMRNKRISKMPMNGDISDAGATKSIQYAV